MSVERDYINVPENLRFTEEQCAKVILEGKNKQLAVEFIAMVRWVYENPGEVHQVIEMLDGSEIRISFKHVKKRDVPRGT